MKDRTTLYGRMSAVEIMVSYIKKRHDCLDLNDLTYKRLEIRLLCIGMRDFSTQTQARARAESKKAQ